MFGTGRSIIDELKARWDKPKFVDRNFYQIAKFHDRRKNADSDYVISDRTRTAVDFTELFSFLDRTVSRVGQQWLYHRLSTYARDENFGDSEELIQYWADHPDERLSAQVALSKINHVNAYGICSLLFDKLPRPPRFLTLIRLQSILSVISLALIAVNMKFILLFVVCLAVNAFVHYYGKGFVQNFAFGLDQLSVMTKVASDVSALNFPYRHKAEITTAIKSLREVTNIWNLFGDSAGSSYDVTELGWLIREYVKIIFLIEPVMFFRALSKLNDRISAVEDVFEYVGRIDASISMLSVRQSSVSCIPVRITTEKRRLMANDMVHPLIEHCVPNSVDIEDRSLLITGSNMSGKSAFIRTLAINVLCAHTINTCFARNFTSTYFRIHAVMNISDDLMLGKSYYMEEVLSIRDMITRSTEGSDCLFLLDEIYRGTNTTERIAAAYSMLSYLNRQNLAVAATHDAELTITLRQDFDMYHFSESIDDGKLSFDYVLKKGRLEHGNAIRILELNGYPSEVVEAARRVVSVKV